MKARWRLVLLMAVASSAMPATAQIGYGYDGEQFLKAVRDGNGAKAIEFVEANGSTVVNYRGGDGDAALHVAARAKSYNWIGYMLQKGADPNLAGRDGDTALIIAARLGFEEGADLLLGKGADVNKANRLGETALIVAIQQRQTNMVRKLLERGADPEKTDHVGYSAHDYAKRETRVPELLRLIESVKPSGASKLKL